MTASPPIRRPAAVRARRAAIHRRRRAVLALVLTGSLSALGLGVHGVLTGPGGVPASAAGAGTAPAGGGVVAEPGDSLWSIAERHHGEAGFRRYLEALIDLNGGTAITAGQVVRLP